MAGVAHRALRLTGATQGRPPSEVTVTARRNQDRLDIRVTDSDSTLVAGINGVAVGALDAELSDPAHITHSSSGAPGLPPTDRGRRNAASS